MTEEKEETSGAHDLADLEKRIAQRILDAQEHLDARQDRRTASTIMTEIRAWISPLVALLAVLGGLVIYFQDVGAIRERAEAAAALATKNEAAIASVKDNVATKSDIMGLGDRIDKLYELMSKRGAK